MRFKDCLVPWDYHSASPGLEKHSIFKVSTVFHVLNDRQMRTITKFSVEG